MFGTKDLNFLYETPEHILVIIIIIIIIISEYYYCPIIILYISDYSLWATARSRMLTLGITHNRRLLFIIAS
jgi:hypothetical protein